MPLSTVCVSTVSSRPRLWSSQTNIRIKDKDVPELTTMNSTEEISVYKNPQNFYPSPTFSKRTTLGYSYDFPEKTVKKEKKWSIGSLFRRKKKEESESSSEEEQKKGFLSRRRRKSDGKRRKPKTVGGFDHVVLPKTSNAFNSYNRHEDTGILSDPSGGFSNYTGRSLPLTPQNNPPQSHNLNNSVVSVTSVGSADSISKKKGKDLVKARAAARRTALGNESSSDDDSSLRSNSSLRIRSDESLAKPLHEIAHTRKSRAARTERYLKRHSKDGENPHNYLRLSKSDADDNRSPSRSPNLPIGTRQYQTSISSSQASNMSGLSTIPPSHGTQGKFRVSNSTSNPSYKPPLSMNDYNNSINKSNSLDLDKGLTNHRSISCDAMIHKAPSFEENSILHVQFPIMRPNTKGYRNLSLIDSSQISSARHPPQPPPRDPNRTVMPHYFENGRPNTFYFDSSFGQPKSKSFHVPSNKFLQPKPSSFNFNNRSTSEVHIPTDPFHIQTIVRPASTTPEPKTYRPVTKREEGFNYLADKNPRSRKPIVIQTNNKVEPRKDSPTQKALDFWKQIEENLTKPSSKPTSTSPQMFTSQTHVQTQVFLPSVLPNDKLEPPRITSPFKPVSPTVKEVHQTEIETSNSKDDVRRKSANLEEALDELEAIYNSLKLGDENLLERAEQREKETLIQRAEEVKKAGYVAYGANRGALSDSSFAYEPFDQVDSPKRKKTAKKLRIPDTKQDDMYNRKISREKAATISDPQSVISKVSYLLSSPIQAAYDIEERSKNVKKNKEPDVTFDDVVYRNVKHAKATPKVIEPQPPFGIPLGPLTPSSNSDYLHATPETICTPTTYKFKKIPDVVKDDLAFRNLRKDSNKEPVLPYKSKEDCTNFNVNFLKKRRAVRSLSANIGNILSKGAKYSDDDVENEFRSNTLTDIADAMEIARKVLQEKGKNISNTRKAFMSDTDARPAYVNGDSFKESRRKFLNGLKDHHDSNSFSSRPPKGLTPERKICRTPTKESTPIPKSALDDSKSTNSSLDDLLNAMAEEAKVTTERITRELEELEQKRNREEDLKNQQTEPDVDCEDLNNCQKLLKAVVDSNDLVEYSKTPSEVAEDITQASLPADSAVIIQSCFGENKIESEHDYENIDSDGESVKKEDFVKCQSPFEAKKSELVATFQELTKNIDEIKVPKFEASDEDKKTDSIYDNYDDSNKAATDNDEGERRFDACSHQDCSSNTNPQLFTSNIEITLKPNNFEHLSCDSARLDTLESLKSPKLVLETSKKCSNMHKSSDMVTKLNKGPITSLCSNSNDLARPSTSRSVTQAHFRDQTDDGEHMPKKPEGPWYHDPTKVAVACSYGIACFHQMASIDLVAVFSLLFAVMSFIAALFL